MKNFKTKKTRAASETRAGKEKSSANVCTEKESGARRHGQELKGIPGEVKASEGLVADSMKAAGAMLNVPLSEVKRAKKNGCEAFRGSRVWIEPLQDWLIENPAAGAASPDKDGQQARLLDLRAQWIEFDLQRERDKKFYDRVEVDRHCESFLTKANTVLDEIPNLAMQLVGRSVEEMQKLLVETTDKVRAALRAPIAA